ncbi:response regulator [Aquimarina hainanensis]|uniref:Response regulator n=1 Tax=Aquimarina hainanensis TaxID=1578017 RepID=A0ABW5N9G4_9FLAO|nr:response regulator [Aquimarina sp. TRL1]QKX05705.1 response regulator [Aquimarina sp. TRL1]
MITENNTTLYLIDDDTIHQFIVKKLISKISSQQNKLLTFSNGEEAILFIESIWNQKEQLPDVILLDINMPIMDGWDFLNAYIKLTPTPEKKINIYILSSSQNPDDLEKAKKYKNIAGYLTKPINESILKELLEF